MKNILTQAFNPLINEKVTHSKYHTYVDTVVVDYSPVCIVLHSTMMNYGLYFPCLLFANCHMLPALLENEKKFTGSF